MFLAETTKYCKIGDTVIALKLYCNFIVNQLQPWCTVSSEVAKSSIMGYRDPHFNNTTHLRHFSYVNISTTENSSPTLPGVGSGHNSI